MQILHETIPSTCSVLPVVDHAWGALVCLCASGQGDLPLLSCSVWLTDAPEPDRQTVSLWHNLCHDDCMVSVPLYPPLLGELAAEIPTLLSFLSPLAVVSLYLSSASVQPFFACPPGCALSFLCRLQTTLWLAPSVSLWILSLQGCSQPSQQETTYWWHFKR